VLDYTFLKIVWWMIMGLILIVYASTAGFDAGVTIIMPFLRNEDDRRIALNTSAPTWDGNLTWLVFAGGGLFVVWPVVYSTAFSGLYLAMLFILLSFYLRPPGYEYRNKIPKPGWRRTWDVALFISGLMPVFLFGVALGNCFVGFPFHFDPRSMRIFYTGSFLQLLNPMGLLIGIMSVIMVIAHGAVFLQRRTEGHLRQLAKKLHTIFTILLLIGFVITGCVLIFYVQGYSLLSSPPHPTLHPLDNVVVRSVGAWVASYQVYPWKLFGPLFAFSGMIVALVASHSKALATAFWASCFSVAGIIGTAGFTLFPFLMPSSTNPNESLTVWNSVANQYALNVMLYIGVFLLIIILGYKIFAYHSIWHKQKTLNVDELRKNEHTFY